MTNKGNIKRLLPAFLKPGDKIMLVAPARFATQTQIDEASSRISAVGFTPVIPNQLDARQNQFGGSDAHRAEILNSAFRDPSIRAILPIRGGYGTGRLLPLIDTAAYLADPTWIIGFSDITALHAWSNNLGIASLHAPVASTMKTTDERDVEWVWDTLKGAPPRALDGTMVGGNLSVLYSLLGTPYFPDCSGCYLFLEDLDEYLYHIDRMMLALKLAGVFEKAKGLIVGDFSELKDNTKAYGQSSDNPFGRTFKEILIDHVPEGFSVQFNMPMGHGKRNYPVILGAP
jgi:muramoyltetrapeptide carboxypeptidase